MSKLQASDPYLAKLLAEQVSILALKAQFQQKSSAFLVCWNV